MDIEDIRPSDLVERQRQAYEEDVRRYQGMAADFVRRDCPACHLEGSVPFVRKAGFQYLRCSACWCVFMSPGPREDHLRWLYSEESANYRFWAKEMYPQTHAARSESLHLPRALWVQRSIKDFAPTPSPSQCRRLLEFGAGTGDTLAALARVEPELDLLGFEPNPLMWLAWTAPVQLVRDSPSLAPLQGSLSFMTAFEVIEHLLLPEELFSLASELLEPGGLLMLSTPNAASLEIQMLKGESPSIDIEHISLMTPSALMCLAGRANLEVLEITTPGEFDVELISCSRAAVDWFGTASRTMGGAAQDLKGLQSKIARSGFSGHMKAVFRQT